MISFKILTEESAESLFNEISAAIPDVDSEFLLENIEMMLDDESEYALSHVSGCLLVRIFDGEYSFAYPIAMVDTAEPMLAVDQIRLYAIKEEIPLVLCDVPSEELGSLLPKFRHANVDATDPDNECYTVRIISEAAMLDDVPIVNGPAAVCLTPITKSDDELYFKLCTDPETNKYWGYDYSADEPNPTVGYFRERAERDFALGNAICLAVRANGEFAGEATLYGFDLLGGCECAVRLLPDFRHNGYATESLNLLKRLAKSIGLVYLSATVDVENRPSVKMTGRCLDELENDGSRVKFRVEL